MKKILIVNVNWVGDVIFSSPVFSALKDAYPAARISCLVPPRVKGILEHIPGVDEIIVYDDKNEHKGPLGKLRLIIRLRNKKFDAAFLLHRSLTRALFLFLAGIPERVGYDTKRRGFLLTHKVEEKKEYVHRSDHYLNVIESFGVKVKDRTTKLVADEKALYEIDKILVKNGIGRKDHLVVINPGGNWGLKRWPMESWSLLVSNLLSQCDLKLVIAGAKKDIELAENICRNNKSVLNLAGKTEFSLLLALMTRADVVISADSGPLHIANSLGTNVIALFGPTAPEITGPRGSGEKKILLRDLGCNKEACYYLDCHDNICMQALTVSDVVRAVNEVKGYKD